MLYLFIGAIMALWFFGLLPTKARRMMARSQRIARTRASLAIPIAPRGLRYAWIETSRVDSAAQASKFAAIEAMRDLSPR